MSEPRATKGRHKPSINDVARHAGVSSQTVSRVANASPKVRAETRDRVLESMKVLGYVPNRAARALRVGGYNTIGVIMHHFARSGEALTIESVVRTAEKHDYATTLVQVSEPGAEGLEHAAQRLAKQSVDGVIIVRAGNVSGAHLRLPPGFPVVVADQALVGDYPAVVGDQIGGTRKAVQHLIDLGHQNIYHVSGSPDASPAHDRQAEWERCLLEAGLTPEEPWPGNWTAQSGYEAGKHIAGRPEITAVFCANDEMAFGVLRALHEEGVKVPGDVSVVGFDSITLSEFSSPPLTTVSIDYDALGEELFNLLLQEINNPAESGKRQQVFVDTQLVVRETTGDVPAAAKVAAGG